jgi:TonB family protein
MAPPADARALSTDAASTDAAATDAPSTDTASTDDLQSPVLLGFVAAAYPESARSTGREGSVLLRLHIDKDGHVRDADVLSPRGHGFDEAAREAALQLTFRPASRRGQPVRSTITFRYDFRLPLPAVGPSVAAPTAAAASPPALSGSPPAPLDVTIRDPSEAARRQQSAEAVTVVETAKAQRESADLGEVLARTRGVGVQRGGGLGSTTRFSLNGLTDDQVRFFLDGLPLELVGFPFGIANVPLNLVSRAEIYSGVVPVRFGADALGGAVNLVSADDQRGRRVALTYQVGSFDTHRLTVSARHLHAPSGFFARANGFFDVARNDYAVDVEVADERGRLSPATVHRFHDAYRADGLNVDLGLVERPWAKRFLLHVFATDHDREYQHNVVMTVPYGGVTYGETARGASLRYERVIGEGWGVDGVVGYSYTRGHFLDVATCVYDWFGRCVRERVQPGETGTRPYDQVTWEHTVFGRFNARARWTPTQALRLSLAPTFSMRTGDDRRQTDPSARDPLSADRRLLTTVAGLEHELTSVNDRAENILFAKIYSQVLRSEEPRPGNLFLHRDRGTYRFGLGEGFRFRFTPWLLGKASYEWATRLPRPDEIFGDNTFIVANLDLRPETSHNVNVTVALDAPTRRSGAWRATVNAFLREADQLIVLLGNDRVQSYQNVLAARSLGVEATAAWTSPGGWLALEGSGTYVDLRNDSSEGTFGVFAGDRIPNRPYLFAHGAARLQGTSVCVPNDQLSLAWNSRYVHSYFRGWESVGLAQSKQVIPSQTVHGVGLVYVAQGARATFSSSVEVQNLTDAQVFDFFGVQRPGRAFFAKTTAEF